MAEGEVAEDLAGLLAQQLEPDRPQKPPQGFIISLSEGVRLRRLHFAGGCWRIPGEHCRRYDDRGQEAPQPHEFTHMCSSVSPGRGARKRCLARTVLPQARQAHRRHRELAPMGPRANEFGFCFAVYLAAFLLPEHFPVVVFSCLYICYIDRWFRVSRRSFVTHRRARREMTRTSPRFQGAHKSGNPSWRNRFVVFVFLFKYRNLLRNRRGRDTPHEDFTVPNFWCCPLLLLHPRDFWTICLVNLEIFCSVHTF